MSSTAKHHILVTDDESSIRSALKEILLFEGYEVSEAAGGKEAIDLLEKEKFDLLLLDIKMKGMDGFELLEILAEKKYSIPVIMLTGHGTIETAVQATRLGAFDFLQKPPDLNRLLITVRNALERGVLVKENRKMKRVIPPTGMIVGDSPLISAIKKTIQKVAPTDARVLITGENGTGKELVAKSLYENSRRSDEAFIEVNCAAIPADLLESELFGHEEGAFTGAVRKRIGKFEQAHLGTLFLDEIGDMPLAAQAKVLRALQENSITRVGGVENIKVNVRVLAATNKDLKTEIAEGRFREDLFHRLNVIPIQVPPLRERREDIPLLAETFLQQMAQKDILFEGKSFSDEALRQLSLMEWTGNVRELHNVVERLGILSSANEITREDVDILVGGKKSALTSSVPVMEQMLEEYDDFQSFKEAFELLFVNHHLNKNGWNISQTADSIGIQRSHLYNKIKKYNLKR